MHFTSRQTLLDWVRRGRLDRAQLPAALTLCELPPGPARWQWLFDRLLLWLGSLCLGAGLVFFVAFNWQDLGRLSRLALLELPLLAMLLLLWRKPLADSQRQALLLAIALNIGALLALVGQTYQTGADPWQLFATWALMLLPLAALGQSPLLWTLSWLLGQLALVLYWRLGLFNFFFAFDEEALGWSLTLFNAALWGILLLVPARYRLMPSWLAGLAAGLGVTLLTLLALFDARLPLGLAGLARLAGGRLPALAPQVHRRARHGLPEPHRGAADRARQMDGAGRRRLPAALPHRHRPVGGCQPLAATTTEVP